MTYYLNNSEKDHRKEKYKKEAEIEGWDTSADYIEIQENRKWVSKKTYEDALLSMNSMLKEIQILEAQVKNLRKENEWLRKQIEKNKPG